MKTYLFIDLSYFIFYLYYARKKYFEFQKKDTTDLINNKEFLESFSNFDIKLNQIKKNLKLPEDVKKLYLLEIVEEKRFGEMKFIHNINNHEK